MNPDFPSTLPPCPVASGIIRRLAESGPDYVERMWAMSDKPRWIPVSERLPDEENEVLVFWPCTGDGIDEESLMAVAWVYKDNKWRDMEGDLKSPTHWMPLPEPPSA